MKDPSGTASGKLTIQLIPPGMTLAVYGLFSKVMVKFMLSVRQQNDFQSLWGKSIIYNIPKIKYMVILIVT